MRRIFTEHPASVGETYIEHMQVALGFSHNLMVGAFACGVHAFLPFLFKTTASRRVSALHDRMVAHRNRKAAAATFPAPVAAASTPAAVEAAAQP